MSAHASGAAHARPPRPIPRAPGLRLVGNLAELLGDPLAFFLKSYLTLGPVFRVSAPTREYTVLAGMEATRFLLREDQRLLDHMPLYAGVAEELSATHYPIATNGDRHLHLRRALKSAFNDELLAPAAPRIFEEIGRFARRYAVGTRLVTLDVLHDLLGNVVVPALTGRALGPLLGDAVRFARFSVGSGLGAYPTQFRYAPRYLLARRRMLPFFRELVAWHRENPPGDARPPDFFDHVLAVRDEHGAELTDENVVALAQMVYSNTLLYVAPAAAFMIYSLLASKRALGRSLSEVDAAARGGGTLPALQACAYFEAAKTESMRLHPIGLAAPRVVRESFVFDGCTLQAGEAVLIAVSAAHYDPAIYPEPYLFEPERHLPPRNESRAPGAFAPLGLGVHSCLGARLVDAMISLTVGALLHAVELELDPPGYTLRKHVNPFPEPEDDFVVRVVGHRS